MALSQKKHKMFWLTLLMFITPQSVWHFFDLFSLTDTLANPMGIFEKFLHNYKDDIWVSIEGQNWTYLLKFTFSDKILNFL